MYEGERCEMSGRKAGKQIKHILEMHVQKVCTTREAKVRRDMCVLQRSDEKINKIHSLAPVLFPLALFEFPRSVSGGILMFAGSA